jgi:hypothetical protein
MSKGRVQFERCIQKKQYYAAGEKSMMDARVFFTLSIDEASIKKLFVDISHPYDTEFESTEIEVGPPVNHMGDYVSYSGPYNHTIYRGPFNHEAFSDYVEEAYRSLVGSSGTGIRIEGASNATMINNTFSMNQSCEMEVSSGGRGPW